MQIRFEEQWCFIVKILQDLCLQWNQQNVLNVFIDIQTSRELIQMDTNKLMTYGTFTMEFR